MQRDESNRDLRARKTPLNLDSEKHFALSAVRSETLGAEELRSSLEDLINGVGPPASTVSSFDNDPELEELEVQLERSQSLLREAEHNNSKLEEQVALLKEEFRRNERAAASADHLNRNMQYFKSVMLTFLAPVSC